MLTHFYCKIAIIKNFFAQKLFYFNIFLLFLHVIRKTIILLYYLIVNIFQRINNDLLIIKFCIKFSIFFVYIFCTFLIFEFLLIYITISIFLVSFRVNNAIVILLRNNIYIVIENISLFFNYFCLVIFCLSSCSFLVSNFFLRIFLAINYLYLKASLTQHCANAYIYQLY